VRLLLIAALVLVAAAVLRLTVPARHVGPTGRGSAGVVSPKPVKQSGRAIAGLLKSVAAYTTSCAAHEPVASFEYPASADATGFVTCQPTGAGATNLLAVAFPDDQAASAELDDYSNFLRVRDGTCDPGAGFTTWTARDTHDHGIIICGFSGTTAYIVWSDATSNNVFVASGPDQSDLKIWWAQVARPLAASPTASEKVLYAAIANRVDTKTCARDDTGGSPFSIASIVCEPALLHGGAPAQADSLYFERFATLPDLYRYLQT
jgi:hypothetical protein